MEEGVLVLKVEGIPEDIQLPCCLPFENVS